MAVMPHRDGPFPIAIFTHGSSEDLTRDGTALRLIAEQGLAAVSFENDQTNQAAFDEEFIALHKYLGIQKWTGGKDWKSAIFNFQHPKSNTQSIIPSADGAGIAWIGCGLGAQRMLSFFARYPEYRPQVFVGISGGWVNDLKAPSGSQNSEIEQAANPETGNRKPGTRVLLLHGEQDEMFPVKDCRRVSAWFEANGIPVTLKIFPEEGHGFGSFQPLLDRAAAEFCAFQLSSVSHQPSALCPIRVNELPTFWWYWIPVGFLCLVVFAGNFWPHLMYSFRHGRRMLWAVAAVLALSALGDSAIHLGLARLRASPPVLKLTRSWLVRPELRADFDWLVSQPLTRNQRIGMLLQHLELADYNRHLFSWQIDDSVYREFILSPWIDSSPASSGAVSTPDEATGRKTTHEASVGTVEPNVYWRRMLWESFYPRVRHESDPEAAAEIVVRFLRERVTVRDEVMKQQSVPAMWQSGVVEPAGFELLYVAALRSVGVAARLGDGNRTEMFVHEKWQPAPRPMVFEVAGSAADP